MDIWLRGPLKRVFEDEVLARRELVGTALDRTAVAREYKRLCDGQGGLAWGMWLLLSLALWERRHFAATVRAPVG
jgi:hypothetical protein